MAGTAGEYNIDDYLIPIDSTLRIYNPGAGSNMNVLGVSPDAIGKIEVDGVTLTTNAQGAMMINLANANTWTATQTFATIVPSLVNISSATTSVTGTTAGSIIWDMPFQGSGYKKANVYNPAAVPGVTVSTTALSIDPNTTTVYTAWIIVEGF